MSKRTIAMCVVAAGAGLGAQQAGAQTSSLYLQPVEQPVVERGANGAVSRMSPAIKQVSYAAVRLPDPRRFAVQDLVTIIINETDESSANSTLETKKDSTLNDQISAFPNLKIKGLLPVTGGTLADPPTVGTSVKNDFKGDSTYTRKDSYTSRVTARIIDIKPNGNLVLEARKYVKTDKETINVTLLGTCRKEDVTAENTVLSTQMYDLRLNKEGGGEVRNGSGKGILTQILDTIFNF